MWQSLVFVVICVLLLGGLVTSSSSIPSLSLFPLDSLRETYGAHSWRYQLAELGDFGIRMLPTLVAILLFAVMYARK